MYVTDARGVVVFDGNGGRDIGRDYTFQPEMQAYFAKAYDAGLEQHVAIPAVDQQPCRVRLHQPGHLPVQAVAFGTVRQFPSTFTKPEVWVNFYRWDLEPSNEPFNVTVVC